MSAFFPVGQLLILPSRLSVDRERLSLLNASSDRVVLAPKVYHFGRLEMELSRQVLPPSRPGLLSDLAQDMIMENLLETRGADLGWPSSRGVRQSMGDLIGQVKSGGLTPETFESLAKEAVSPAKLKGFLEIFTAYQDFLKEQNLQDQADRRRELIASLTNGPAPRLLEEAREVIVRDFSRFTPFHLELMIGMARWVNRVEIHLTCPEWLHNFKEDDSESWKGNPFSELLGTVRMLESAWRESSNLELMLEPPDDVRPAPFKRLSHLFQPHLQEADLSGETDRIEITAAPGRYAELEHIGRRIWQLIDQGVEPDRIAVAVRNLGEYGQLVEDVFRRFRLPLFFRRGAPLNIQAPARALLALMRLAVSRWNIDLVLDVLASPYLDAGLTIPWTEAARLSLEAGVTDERAGGGWVRNLKRLEPENDREADNIDAVLNCIQTLRDRLGPLAGARSWPDFVQQAFKILQEMKLEEKILERPGPEMHRDALAWNALKACLEELVFSSRQAGLESDRSPGDLLRGLSAALEGRNIGQDGDSQGGIMVLSAFDLHGLSFDYLFLAGLNEGEFPKTKSSATFLEDTEIAAVNQAAGSRLLKSSSTEYREEELLFFQAVNGANKRLYLSYSRMDEEGRIRLPSALLDELLRLWPEGALEVFEPRPRVLPPVDEIMTREELLSFLAANLLGRNRDDYQLAENLRTQLNELDPDLARRYDHLEVRVLVERLREENGGGRFNGEVRSQSLKTWKEKLKREGRVLLSPTFFQDYGNCPFIFWARRVMLTADPLEPIDEVNVMAEGTILHDILKNFMMQCRDNGWLPLSGDPREATLLEAVCELEWDRAESKHPVGRLPLWRVRRRFLARVLSYWLTVEQNRKDDFIPKHFEWDFGIGKDAAPALEVPLVSGGRVFLRGRVDRIDESPDMLRVLDYKNSANRNYYNLLKEEELGRTSFQAPVYQAAVSRILDKPAVADWVLLRDFKGRRKPSGLPSNHDFFILDTAVRAEMDREGKANFYNRLEATWRRIENGSFSPLPKKGQCDFCEFQTICRYQKLETGD